MEIDRILSQIDADLSGEITFSEFLVACIDPKTILSNDRLLAAFNTFDVDHGGTISIDEIKMALCAGKNIDDKVWGDILTEVDPNGDAEISFNEFKVIMERIFNITSTKKISSGPNTQNFAKDGAKKSLKMETQHLSTKTAKKSLKNL